MLLLVETVVVVGRHHQVAQAAVVVVVAASSEGMVMMVGVTGAGAEEMAKLAATVAAVIAADSQCHVLGLHDRPTKQCVAHIRWSGSSGNWVGWLVPRLKADCRLLTGSEKEMCQGHNVGPK